MMGLTGEVGTEAGEPMDMNEALSAPDVDKWNQTIEEELHGLWEKGSFQDKESLSNIKPIKARFIHKLTRQKEK